MEEAGQSLQILSSIVDVYPETRNELFNRHSALLESLTAQFQALYEGIRTSI